MKVKKAIKKIAALGMGATMLGATILGASAADLGNYPGMFMDNGQFNGLIVVGKQADSVDTIGGMNIMGGLQAAAVTTTTVCGSGSSSAASVSEGVKIEKSSQDFMVGTSIFDIQSTLDDGDLPEVLADGNYDESEGDTKNDVDYTQVLNFVDNTGMLGYFQDDDDASEAGAYLLFNKSTNAYQYVLEFDSPVDFSATAADQADDVESTTLEIQGQTYTITEAEFTAGSLVDKLTLMVGDTLMWMTQDETITKSINGVEHEITMLDVTENADACGFQVDGTSVWIDTDTTETVNGVTLGVTDAKAVHTETYDADICKVSLGATELILEDGNEVDKDGTEVDGSEVDLAPGVPGGTNTATEWNGITITYQPEDDMFLTAGDELVDPVFGNFKFVFGGLNADYEEISMTTGSDDAELSFMNSDGKEVSIPFYAVADATDGDVYLGDGPDDDDYIYYTGFANCSPASGDVTDCEGARWLVEVSGEAHLIELKDVDTNNFKVDFEDLTYGTTDNDNDYVNSTNTTVYISGLGNIFVDVIEASIALSGLGSITNIETEEGATISTFAEMNGYTNTQIHDGLGAQPAEWNIGFTENDDDNNEASIDFTVAYDEGTDESIEVYFAAGNVTGVGTASSGAGLFSLALLDKDDDDNDNKVGATYYGSVISYDSEDDNELVIQHPDDSAKADVFVAPTGAALSVSAATGGDCQVSETVNKIPSTVNKFDTEVSNPNMYNLVSVGGPCANSVTSALLGNPEVCYEGFEAGKALLKLVESGDKVALVVAGGTGADTRIASTVLQNYEQYESQLTGAELMLTTVSENNIGFEAVQ